MSTKEWKAGRKESEVDKVQRERVEREESTKAKHTPGPWKVERAPLNPNPRVYGRNGGALVVVVSSGAAFARETEANASLIAAAPDLLAALERLARLSSEEYAEEFKRGEHLYPDVDLAVARKMALAAIAKARGES